ncbi:E3 ubiquitin protein ligase DRIP1 [Bienertia sinuspersici]
MEDQVDGSSSPETLNKIIQNKKQTSSAKSSNDQIRGENMENNNEGREGKVDLWKPLNTLVEAANRSKFSKSNLQGASHPKADPSNAGDADMGMSKTRSEENGQDELEDDKSGMPPVSGPAKRKRLRPSNRNRSSVPAESLSPQVVVNEARQNWKDGPIWFSLVASEDQEGGELLPQVSAAFLRVKDGSMPVSYIQKYIAKKLDLASETEIQIMCEGQPVMPHLKLSSLLEAWLRTSSTQRRYRHLLVTLPRSL